MNAAAQRWALTALPSWWLSATHIARSVPGAGVRHPLPVTKARPYRPQSATSSPRSSLECTPALAGEPAPSEPGAPASFTTTTREDLAAQSWLPHATLIPGAFDALASEDADVAANASQLLCSLIAASTEAPACLEEGEAGRERCAQLVASCLGKDVSDPPNLSALEVVLQLLTRQRESQAPSQVADSLLGAVEADIDRFFAAVAAPSPLPDRFARFFSSDECPAYRPRGQQRCKLLLLLEECLKSERPSLTTPLVDLGLFPIVIDLLLMPHTCNALHMRTAAILEWAIFFTGPSAALTTTVRKALISEAELAQRLIKLVGEYAPPSAAKAAESAEPAAPAAAPAKGKPLPCCHSFVMHIGACLLSAAQREPEVRALLEEYDGWELFIAPGGPLTTWEQRMNKPLGGLAPTRGSDDNDSDDEEELDVATMERVLAATAASQRNSDLNSTSDHDDRHQDDDDEGGHSSEYLQHFADYLSNRNFLNQVRGRVGVRVRDNLSSRNSSRAGGRSTRETPNPDQATHPPALSLASCT